MTRSGDGSSGTLSVAGTAALALGTWAVTVVAADRMRAVGYRGPFELLVRRVSYGPSSAGAPGAPGIPGAGGAARRPTP